MSLSRIILIDPVNLVRVRLLSKVLLCSAAVSLLS